MIGDKAGETGGMGVIEGDIAVVDDVHLFQWVGRPAVGRIEGLQGRCLADSAGAKAGARAVGDGLIERQFGDRKVNPVRSLL